MRNPEPGLRTFRPNLRISNALGLLPAAAAAFLLHVSAGCGDDLFRGIGDANPLLARITAPGMEEIRAMNPRERYSESYRFMLAETLNLARGAEEGNDTRSANASGRIIACLVIMLGAVEDPDAESRLVRALSELIKLGESLLLGSKDPSKAGKVRRLRDRFAADLSPGLVKAYAASGGPGGADSPVSGRIVSRKRTETVLEGGNEMTKFFLTIRGADGKEHDVEVDAAVYGKASVGKEYAP